MIWIYVIIFIITIMSIFGLTNMFKKIINFFKGKTESPIIKQYNFNRSLEYYNSCMKIFKDVPKEDKNFFLEKIKNPSQETLNQGCLYPLSIYMGIIIKNSNKEKLCKQQKNI